MPLKADMLRAGIDVCYVPIADIADATPQSKGLGKLSDSAVIVEPPEHPEEPAWLNENLGPVYLREGEAIPEGVAPERVTFIERVMLIIDMPKMDLIVRHVS